MVRDPAGHAEVEAARLLLSKMGVSPAELLTSSEAPPPVPTFGDYIPVVRGVVGEGTRRVYGSYWRRIDQHWGHRRLDEPTVSEIKQLVEQVRQQAQPRRTARGGRSAAEHLVAALRCVYSHAVADGWISEADNPARLVAKPRRLPSTRRGLSAAALAEINRVAASTGNDPALDALLLRLHTETACRRGGALALRPIDLDSQQCLILLREKGGVTRWQPVSPMLMRHLLAHAQQRAAIDPEGPLLRAASGRAITTRRYDYLWARLGRHLSWVAAQQVSTHWLRHTTLTWVERHFGYAVARAYAGHTDSRTGAGTTVTYIRADLDEIATALAALTGEPHPLATSTRLG